MGLIVCHNTLADTYLNEQHPVQSTGPLLVDYENCDVHKGLISLASAS